MTLLECHFYNKLCPLEEKRGCFFPVGYYTDSNSVYINMVFHPKLESSLSYYLFLQRSYIFMPFSRLSERKRAKMMILGFEPGPFFPYSTLVIVRILHIHDAIFCTFNVSAGNSWTSLSIIDHDIFEWIRIILKGMVVKFYIRGERDWHSFFN